MCKAPIDVTLIILTDLTFMIVLQLEFVKMLGLFFTLALELLVLCLKALDVVQQALVGLLAS